MRKTTFITFLFVVINILACWQGYANSVHSIGSTHSQIKDIRIADRGDFTRFVLEVDGAAFDYRTFALESPQRYVVDLKEVRWSALRGNAPYRSSLIKGVRHGQFNSKILRLVIDLKTAVKLKNQFMIPPDNKVSQHRLVIDLEPVNPAFYNKNKPQIANLPLSQQKRLALEKGAPKSMSYRQDQEEGPASFEKKSVPAAPLSQSLKSPLSQPLSPQPLSSPMPPPNIKPRTKIIVLDPGHGGVDPGAIGHLGVKEKDITLGYAHALKKELQSYGNYKIFLTRESDYYIPLKKRVERARKLEADLFISLHADSHPDSDVRGLSVYTLSEKASDKEAARLANTENKKEALATVDLSDVNKEAQDILIDLVKSGTMNKSAKFAEMIVKELGGEAKLLKNTHRFAGFVVLTGIDVPSVLVELGYLSNRLEEKLLTDSAYRKKLVASVAKAVDRYFTQH